MKKFLTYILILVVLVGIFSPTNKVSAQLPTDLGTCTRVGPDNEPIVEPNVQRSTCPNGFGQSFQQNSPSGASPVADPGATKIGLKAGSDCWAFGNIGDCISSIFARIAWLIMKMMSWLLWLAGVLLNYVIEETVLTMKEGVDKMTGINIGWKVIRDIMNIGFIFLLVYEGILMIIGQSSREKVKKYIFSIVLAALLINFSLFFTKVLIDASNIVTIGLYNTIIDSSTQSSVPGGDSSGDVIERPIEGISAYFMQALNLQQLYGGNSFSNISDAVGGETNMLIFFLMGSVLFLILTFVFFAISIMFIIRYITLLILLVTSPVAYMGSAIPGMSTYSKQWWESLKGQLLFAPIYMLITMVVLKLIESENFIKTSGAEWSSFVNNSSNVAAVSGANTNSAMSLILNFAVIIGLAIASLVIAKTSATKGSNYIKDATGKLTAFAGGAVMGGAGRLGRSTLGRGGDLLSQNDRLKALAFKTDENGNVVARGGLGGFVARTALKTSDSAAKSSFDLRSTKKTGFQALSKITETDFGKGSDPKKVNFRKEQEAVGEKKAEFAKLLKPSDNEFDIAKAKDAEEKERLKSIMNSAETTKNESETKMNDLSKEINDLNKKIEQKKEDYKKAGSLSEKSEIDKERKRLEDELKTKQETLKGLENIAKENKKIFDSAKKKHDEYKSKQEDILKKIYSDRVGAYADMVENESSMSVWTKNILKGGAIAGVPLFFGGAAVGGATLASTGGKFITTERDRKAWARTIKGVIKEKPKITKDSLEKALGIKIDGDKEGDTTEGEEKKDDKPEEKPKTS